MSAPARARTRASTRSGPMAWWKRTAVPKAAMAASSRWPSVSKRRAPSSRAPSHPTPTPSGHSSGARPRRTKSSPVSFGPMGHLWLLAV